MLQARHVGKIVVHNALAEHAVGGVNIIVGGQGALGLLVAEWLVRRGAREVHLLGRRGHMTGATRAAIAASLRGAAVTLTQCDASIASDRAVLAPGMWYSTICKANPEFWSVIA